MGWLTRRKAPRRASFPIGVYRLDSPVEGLAGLVEFTPTEYAQLAHRYEGEKNYNAPPVLFLGHSWRAMLQTAYDQICKITLYMEVPEKPEAYAIATETLHFCTGHLGKPADRKAGLVVWDTTNGNVVLQTGETEKGLSIGLFLTSRSVRSYKKP
ncbi:MAG TPA: hypothetical protein VEI03_22700 [Stellaceae bacterium]|nr:hypothetical protein [Stellaceae bacterium]